MNRKFFIAGLIIIAHASIAQTKYTITEVIQLAINQSPFSKQALTQKETSYWQYVSYKTNYNPQLRLNASSPYTSGFSNTPQNDGSVAFRQATNFTPSMNLGLLQPIPWTGGTVSVNTNYLYINSVAPDPNNPGANINREAWQSGLYNIQLTQPVFSYNPLRWDKKTKPIILEESKRQYVQDMESISREAASRFFDVLTYQANEQIAKFNLANNDTIHKIEQGRYNIGTTSQDKLLQVELQLLRSRQDVAQAKLDLQNGMLRLRTYIGLKDGDNFNLVMPEAIPEFELTEEEALAHAKKNRADYIAFDRRRIEAEASVAQAKGQRYQANISASYGLNNSAPIIPDLYRAPSTQQIGSLSFNIPIIDWGRRRSLMQTAYANKRLNDFTIAQDEVNFEQEIITQVRQFELLRLQIEITKKSDAVALERYIVAQNRYLIGKIDITNLAIALTEKDNAKRNYITALKSFWTAYFNLRRLTLYDFVTGKSLYAQADAN
ncbi:membrane protein [Cytophagales bacterium WSM2-2]|nr:membrane protein [Cytophagales bacterium WSM2-2]